MNILRITNGRVIDPAQNLDQITDLWIRGEYIVGIGPQPRLQPTQVLDATGKIVCPGLIDMNVHLCEPGREEDETIATGTAAVPSQIDSAQIISDSVPPAEAGPAIWR